MDLSEANHDERSNNTEDSSGLGPSIPNLADIPKVSVTTNGGPLPFKRWVDNIRRKKSSVGALPEKYVAGWPSEGPGDEDQLKKFNTFTRIRQERQNKYSSASSSVLETVKSASMSAASLSVMSGARRNTKCSTRQSACHSSGLSGSEVRMSIDSNVLTSTFSLDEAAWNRATKRRQLLREINTTEASYVAGLKALANVSHVFTPQRSRRYMVYKFAYSI
jgi:hypothetical protein